MNARQRRDKEHQHRMQARRWARTIVRSHARSTSPLARILAHITLQPDAFKTDPKFNWWGEDHKAPSENQPWSPYTQNIVLDEAPAAHWCPSILKRRIITT